jgi:hypothetical protein
MVVFSRGVIRQKKGKGEDVRISSVHPHPHPHPYVMSIELLYFSFIRVDE